MSDNRCRICSNELNNEKVQLHATMYGTKGEFSYFICSQCGCLQICERPEDMSKYYDNSAYYSFNMEKRKFRNYLLFKQMQNQVTRKNLPGALIQGIYPVNYSFYRNIDPKTQSILDVGCGQGEMLVWLKKLGFTNVSGVEPFAEQDIDMDGIHIHKTEIIDYHPDTKYDMITFIHAIEHVYEVKETIQKVDTLLKDEGYLVFQLPFFSQYYWEKYRENLYTLDPPRHFYIHTKKSLDLLVEPLGYEVVSFDTEIDIAIPGLARNIIKGETEKNQGTGFVSGILTAFTSQGLRKKLKKSNDGAIATIVFKKRG